MRFEEKLINENRIHENLDLRRRRHSLDGDSLLPCTMHQCGSSHGAELNSMDPAVRWIKCKTGGSELDKDYCIICINY